MNTTARAAWIFAIVKREGRGQLDGEDIHQALARKAWLGFTDLPDEFFDQAVLRAAQEFNRPPNLHQWLTWPEYLIVVLTEWFDYPCTRPDLDEETLTTLGRLSRTPGAGRKPQLDKYLTWRGWERL